MLFLERQKSARHALVNKNSTLRHFCQSVRLGSSDSSAQLGRFRAPRRCSNVPSSFVLAIPSSIIVYSYMYCSIILTIIMV